MGTPKNIFRAGLVQQCATRDVAQNVEELSELIRTCAKEGAQFVSTPEMSHLLETSAEEIYRKTAPEEDDQGVRHFAGLARELGLWLNIAGYFST